MGRYLSADDEEVLRSFRPHPVSWIPSYLAGLSWLAWGGIAWAVARWFPVSWSSHAGWSVFLLLAILHAVVRVRVVKSRRVWLIHGAAAIVIILSWGLSSRGLLLPAPWGSFDPVLVGAIISAGGLVAREAERIVTRTYVTTQRIVARRGLTRRRESALLYGDVERVDSEQRLLGALFGFGRLRLARKTRRKGRRAAKNGTSLAEGEDVVELRGVPRFEEARRDVNTLTSEVRLSERERQKRLEERRLKESLVQLSHWRPPRTP